MQLNFCKDPCSIKEVTHDQAHDHIDHVAHYPITHVPHPPRCPISIFSINHDTHVPKLLSCAPLPMCPIPQGTPSLSLILHMIPLCPYVPLPMCPVTHIKKDVKLSKRCQAVKKMSSCQKDVKLSKRCQMSKSQTHGLWRRFTKK